MNELLEILLPELVNTLIIVSVTTIITIPLSIVLGLLLFNLSAYGLHPCKSIYNILSGIINFIRSVPILLTIIALIPLVRFILGTAVGPLAVSIPLSVTQTAYLSRLIENSYRSVSIESIESGLASGLGYLQICFLIIIPEAKSNIISASTLGIVGIIAASTMAGVVGAGGIGAIALSYGYQSFNTPILLATVLILIVLNFLVIRVGNILNKNL